MFNNNITFVRNSENTILKVYFDGKTNEIKDKADLVNFFKELLERDLGTYSYEDSNIKDCINGMLDSLNNDDSVSTITDLWYYASYLNPHTFAENGKILYACLSDIKNDDMDKWLCKWDEYSNDMLESLGLAQCYYTDLWYFEDLMVETAYGDLIIEEKCDGEYVNWCSVEECFYPIDETTYIPSEDIFVCEDALDRYYIWSEFEDAYISDDVSVAIYDEDEDICSYVREDYAESNYYYCNECGRYFTYDAYDCECDTCIFCEGSSNKIMNYHFHSNDYERNMYGDTTDEINGYCGFELEVERGDDAICESDMVDDITDVMGNRIALERDGSLDDGFEIISYPHSYSEWKNVKDDVNEMLERLSNGGYTSHDNGDCGLHFHFSRTLFGNCDSDRDDNISKLIYFFNKHYDDLVRFSRRSIDQASSWAKPYYYSDIEYGRSDDDITDKGDIKEFYKMKGNSYSYRYKAVNITNYHTVEIRLMRGTLNQNTFWATMDLCWRLVINCKHISWYDIDDLSLWFKDMEVNTLEYMSKRRAFVEYVGITNNATAETEENRVNE